MERNYTTQMDAARRGMIASGECTSCGRCAAVCPENAIVFAPRFRARPGVPTQNSAKE